MPLQFKININLTKMKTLNFNLNFMFKTCKNIVKLNIKGVEPESEHTTYVEKQSMCIAK